jgi:hypothetical protein
VYETRKLYAYSWRSCPLVHVNSESIKSISTKFGIGVCINIFWANLFLDSVGEMEHTTYFTGRKYNSVVLLQKARCTKKIVMR